MDKLSVESTGLEAYAASAAGMATELLAAGGVSAAAGPALLGPVFGLIGGDFVAAFATAHGAHLASITKLSGVLGSMGVATGVSAAAYTGQDAVSSAAMKAASAGLEV